MDNQDLQTVLDELLDSFSNLTPEMKKQEIVKKLKDIGETLYNLNMITNKQGEILSSNSLLQLNVNNEYEFLNGIYILIHFIENEMGKNLSDEINN